MSFFDDDDGDEGTPSTRTPRPRPDPRRPQRVVGTRGPDAHSLMVRRRLAAGVGVVILIVIVLAINGCLKSQHTQALKTYNEDVNKIAQESEQQISKPLFSALSDAAGQSPIVVSNRVNQLRSQAQEEAAKAEALSVPSEMTSAQRNVVLALNLRAEGLTKIAGLVTGALGGQAKAATGTIAGDMEVFLASDVLYSQRVVPLITEALHSGGVSGESISSSRFLPNLGWLEAKTVEARISGTSSGSSSSEVAPGSHGHELGAVSVGTNTLSPQPALNHISGGANPTFTVAVVNSGENNETNVKVDLEVEGGERKIKVSRTINKTEAGSTASVDIPVQGVSLGDASRITIYIHPVPGESNTENNKGVFLATFEH